MAPGGGRVGTGGGGGTGATAFKQPVLNIKLNIFFKFLSFSGCIHLKLTGPGHL